MIHLLLTKQNIEPVGNTLATHPAPGKPLKRQFRFSRRSSAWQSNGLLNRWSRVQIPAPAPFSVLGSTTRCSITDGSVLPSVQPNRHRRLQRTRWRSRHRGNPGLNSAHDECAQKSVSMARDTPIAAHRSDSARPACPRLRRARPHPKLAEPSTIGDRGSVAAQVQLSLQVQRQHLGTLGLEDRAILSEDAVLKLDH